MESERRRHPVIMHNMWWSVTVVLPSAVQPFLFTHFRRDGWDDELVFRVRNVGVVVIFRSDPRSGHAQQFETTLCVPVATALNLVSKLDAGIDQPDGPDPAAAVADWTDCLGVACAGQAIQGRA